jgi:iron(III) transport system substrate-binding protein
MRTIRNCARLALVALVAAAACSRAEPAKEAAPAPGTIAAFAEVNVYSARHYEADLAVYDRFTRDTGIKVNLIEAQGDALIERLSREAEASPADLFITADAGILWRAEQRGVLQPIADPSVLSLAPEQAVGPDGLWIGLTKRARIIVYNKEMGLPLALKTYEDLADPSLKGAICARPASNVYNQSLVASIIAHKGEAEAKRWTEGLVANFARAPQGSDTTQIESVAAGECRLAVVNSYYVARYVGGADEKSRAVASRVGVFFPSQETTGAHVNISGAGIAKHAPNRANAVRLLAFLLMEDQQREFAFANNEYPVIASVAPEGPVASFGAFKADDLPMRALGENQPAAVRLMAEAGWK